THVTQILIQEQASFLRTLEHGTTLLESLLNQMHSSGQKTLDGVEVFRLHDTYGFPVELTREIASERGFEIDEDGFNNALEAQRERSRGAFVQNVVAIRSQVDPNALQIPTEFLGYESTNAHSRVTCIFKDGAAVDGAAAGDKVDVVLDR